MFDMDHTVEGKEVLEDPVLQVLPEMDRMVIRMRAFGLSVEEIAMVTGTTPDAVDARLSAIEQTLTEFKSFLS